MANNYGKQIITMLSDGQALPSSTSVDSDSMAYIGGSTNGSLAISVYAKTAISIANTKVFKIDVQGYTSDTGTSATSPFSSSNTGPSGTLLANATAPYTIFDGLASGGAMAFGAGDLITQFIIPQELFDKLGYDWIQLVYTTTADESSETVDAFLHALF